LIFSTYAHSFWLSLSCQLLKEDTFNPHLYDLFRGLLSRLDA
jgi:hypothetical protein